MNNHLSSKQIDELIIGDAGPAQQQHIRECAACRNEVARLQEPLSIFRDAMWQWSQQHRSHTPAPDMRRRSLRWLVAVTALVMLAMIPVRNEVRERQRQAESAQDRLLFERMNAHLSRDVPASMEMLMDLVADGTILTEEDNGGIQ